MQPFISFEAVAVPFDQPNIDTDQIIPARYLGRPRIGQVEGLFRDLRYDDGGAERPEFVLNRLGFRGAGILVAERNFGCGSSRENAVTALLDNGLRAFVAPSFGDIFHNNCFQNGVLPVRLPSERVAEIRRLLWAAPGARIAIDLQHQTLCGPDGRVDGFDIDAFRKDCLLRGTTMLEVTDGHEADITAFEARQKHELPWL